MGTIVCRHRNHTIFDRLSDNYSRQVTFLAFTIENGKAKEVLFNISRLHSELERDSNKINMRWYKANKSGLETPNMVLKDALIGDESFISLCGHICNISDYEETDNVVDVTEIVSDIFSRQPKSNGRMLSGVSIKNKILHFDEIPSENCFRHLIGRDFTYGFQYQSVSKYHRDILIAKGTDESYYRGNSFPLLEDGFYENINFYEDDAIWHNPGKKFVQINHAVNSENFFDKDGYLCSIYNYEHVSDEKVEQYKKIFLFLV